MRKHTPGPWRISAESQSIVEQDNQAIGSKLGLLIATAHGYTDSGYFPDDDEGVANARLIAAAPELLEALKIFLNEFNDFEVMKRTPIAYHKVVKAAHAAIAKAEGEVMP